MLFLVLDLAYVVLYLAGHVVEGPRHLPELVPAGDRHGRAVVAGGDPYGGVAGLGEGAGDLAGQQQAGPPGEQDARADGPDYPQPQVREALVQLVLRDVVDHDAPGDAPRVEQRPHGYVGAVGAGEDALALRRGGHPLYEAPLEPQALVGPVRVERVAEPVAGGEGPAAGAHVEHREPRGVGDGLHELPGVALGRRQGLVLGTPEALDELGRPRVRRAGALDEQGVLRLDEPLLGEVEEHQPDHQAGRRGDPDERDEDPALEPGGPPGKPPLCAFDLYCPPPPEEVSPRAGPPGSRRSGRSG